MVTQAEDLNLTPGDQLEGILKSKRLGVKTKFKETPLVFIELLDDFVGKTDTTKKGHKPQKFTKGTMVSLWVKAGLKAIMDVPEGSAVLIKNVGLKDMSDGKQPMNMFEIMYE
jgi:hypothetical protein